MVMATNGNGERETMNFYARMYIFEVGNYLKQARGFEPQTFDLSFIKS